jgi:hypothetical protein
LTRTGTDETDEGDYGGSATAFGEFETPSGSYDSRRLGLFVVTDRGGFKRQLPFTLSLFRPTP